MANVDIGVRAGTQAVANGSVASAPRNQGGGASSPSASQNTAEGGGTTSQKSAVDDPRLKKLLETDSKTAQITSRNLKINIDDASGMYVVSIHDAKTNELIRQIPQDSVLHMAQTISKILDESQGSLINEHT
jgi:flagellar protein FlaG